MARKTPVQLVGGAYSDDALPWTAQDCVNYIPVFAEKEGARSPKILRGAPGCSLFTADMAEAPIRGLYDCEGLLLAVAGNTLYRIASTGAATSLGTIPGTERVTFAHNQVTGGHQVAIGNGQSGYVYDTSDSSFSQITDEGFPGFRSVDFIDQFIIGVEPFGRYWLHSDLSDATAYNTLDRYVAEKAPDLIQQVIASGSDVFVLGQRKSQFFYNTGAATGTFANRPGTEMDIGAASPWTACRLDNTVYWLGHDGSVYRLEGNQPRRVSTHALEQAFSRADTSQAYAYTFEDRGHKIYYITVGGRTWGFDVATGEWHRRKSYGLNFWRFSSLTRHRGRWFGGDYTNGRLYLLDWALQDEAGAELERSRISPVLHDDQNKVICNLLELVFDTGMDSTSPPLPIPLLEEVSISGDLVGGYVGATVDYAYTITGGTQPVTTSVSSGTFPPGLTLGDDGVATGAFTTAGAYSWTVMATDAAGNTASVADSCTVENVSTLYEQVTYTGDGTASRQIPTTVDLSGGGLVIFLRNSTGADALYSLDGSGTKKIDMSASSAATLTTANAFGNGYFELNGENALPRTRLLNENGSTYTAHVFKKEAGVFDVIEYNGTGASNTITHGLGVDPGMIMLQRIGSDAPAYVTYLKTMGTGKGFVFYASGAPSTDASHRPYESTPGSVNFTLAAAAFQNTAAEPYVAFLWADNSASDGVIRNVTWTGTGAVQSVTSADWQPQSMFGRGDVISDPLCFMGDDYNANFVGNDKRSFPDAAFNADTSVDVVGLVTDGFQLNDATVWNTSAVVYHAMVMRKPT